MQHSVRYRCSNCCCVAETFARYIRTSDVVRERKSMGRLEHDDRRCLESIYSDYIHRDNRYQTRCVQNLVRAFDFRKRRMMSSLLLEDDFDHGHCADDKLIVLVYSLEESSL